MLKVIGIQHKTGDWEMNGNSGKYDNQMFYCTDDEPIGGLTGLRVSSIKIKTSLVDEFPVLGDNIRVFYDEYRKPNHIEIMG